MGVEIKLTGSGFDRSKWRRELGNVAYTEEVGPMVSPLCLGLLSPDEADLILFDDEGDREASADAEVWLLPVGGIRGVTVKNDASGIVLSMPVSTGTGDWELAETLAKIGIECGASVEVDGEAVAGEVDFGKLAGESWQMSLGTMQALSSEGHEVMLPVLVNHLHLEIAPDDLDSPSLHDDLVARMERYGEAHLASDMVMRSPAGVEMHLNVAGGVPTFIQKESDGIVLYDAPEDVVPMSGGLFDGAPIPTARFLEIVGDRAESAGPVVYVPLIKYSAIPDLFEALKAAAAEADFGSASGGGDQNVLAHGPVLIFLFVAGADGTVDKKEAAAFQSLLQNSELAPGDVFQQMLRDARDHFPQILQEITSQGKPPQLVLVEFLKALDECPPEEALQARQGLYALGHAVASASGGFLGFGSKISKSEKNALQVLQTMLGVDPGEFPSG